jgi:hypothetical protein
MAFCSSTEENFALENVEISQQGVDILKLALNQVSDDEMASALIAVEGDEELIQALGDAAAKIELSQEKENSGSRKIDKDGSHGSHGNHGNRRHRKSYNSDRETNYGNSYADNMNHASANHSLHNSHSAHHHSSHNHSSHNHSSHIHSSHIHSSHSHTSHSQNSQNHNSHNHNSHNHSSHNQNSHNNHSTEIKYNSRAIRPSYKSTKKH